jgi:hypothetical protein
MSPKDKYWLVTVEVVDEDENGKIKRSKEKHLVDAFDVVGVEKKVKETMDGETRDWVIKSIVLAGIIEVY